MRSIAYIYMSEYTEEFIRKAKIRHNNKFDYSKIGEFSTLEERDIEIICPIHDSFWRTPLRHLNYGCNKCAILYRNNLLRKTQEKFIEDAIKVHNNKYIYTETIYFNQSTKIKIICEPHGIFIQSPKEHLNVDGCPVCFKRVSNPERRWLDSYNIPIEFRSYTIRIGKKRIFADGFDPATNTVYEFNGDYWHGNPAKYNHSKINNVSKKTFGELYQNTLNKEHLLKEAGYNVISIWESDWNKQMKENKL